MRYPDGQQILLGDFIEVFPGLNGRVVCLLEENLYEEGFLAEEWSFLKTGVLIKMSNGALAAFPDTDQHFNLLKRKE